MKLTEKQIEEFQKIYSSKFGVEIDHEQALRKATSLLTLVKSVLVADSTE